MSVSEPGLVSREIVGKIIDANEEYVTIHEVWDLKAKGCPIVCLDETVIAGLYDRYIHMSPLEYKLRFQEGQT